MASLASLLNHKFGVILVDIPDIAIHILIKN